MVCGYANLERVMTSFHRLLEIQLENVTGLLREGSDTEPSFARHFGRKTMHRLGAACVAYRQALLLPCGPQSDIGASCHGPRLFIDPTHGCDIVLKLFFGSTHRYPVVVTLKHILVVGGNRQMTTGNFRIFPRLLHFVVSEVHRETCILTVYDYLR